MRNYKALGFVAAFLLISAVGAQGQEVSRSWGVGAFLDYNRSMFQLKDWYEDGRGRVGLAFTYVASSRLSVEMEYHHAMFDHGSLEQRTFIWPVDGKKYTSPNAVSKMKMNSFLVNALIRRGGSDMLRKWNYSPYVTVGAGFYDYATDVSGLIFPGQKIEPLDQGLELEPFSDTRTALGVNIGGGVEAFVFDNISVDLRARYNVLLGELRPMEAWGLIGQTFPMQFWSLRGGMRFYFKR